MATKRRRSTRVRFPKRQFDEVEIKEEAPEIVNLLYNNDDAECQPNGTKFIQCFICNAIFWKIYKLRAHMMQHLSGEGLDEQTLIPSTIYAQLNPDKRNIETRIIKEFIINELNAEHYSQFYGILNEANVELHISDSETETESVTNEEAQAIPRNSYNCTLCPELSFSRRYEALYHQNNAHATNDLTIACDYCQRKFMGIELLLHHLKTRCENDEQPIGCVERFRQHLCEVNLKELESLSKTRQQIKEERLKTAKKKYTCNVCHKDFLRSEHLSRHRTSVHLSENQKPQCQICYKRFTRTDNLAAHMIKVHMVEAERESQTATETMPILCQFCGHCFTDKANYVVHMRLHNGEKPFKCEVCGRGFAQTSELYAHQVTHKESKFACKICEETFLRESALAVHMRKHQGPYNCIYCFVSFKFPSELAVHLRDHVNVDENSTAREYKTNANILKKAKHFAKLRYEKEQLEAQNAAAFLDMTEEIFEV